MNADPNKLAQVIRNMVSNAMKFTKRDGTIMVSVSAEYRTDTNPRDSSIRRSIIRAHPSESESFPFELVLSVTDSGAGISKVLRFTTERTMAVLIFPVCA